MLLLVSWQKQWCYGYERSKYWLSEWTRRAVFDPTKWYVCLPVPYPYRFPYHNFPSSEPWAVPILACLTAKVNKIPPRGVYERWRYAQSKDKVRCDAHNCVYTADSEMTGFHRIASFPPISPITSFSSPVLLLQTRVSQYERLSKLIRPRQRRSTRYLYLQGVLSPGYICWPPGKWYRMAKTCISGAKMMPLC